MINEKDTIDKNMKSKVKEIAKLEMKNNNLENENTKLKEKLGGKDDEMRNVMEEKASLQEK